MAYLNYNQQNKQQDQGMQSPSNQLQQPTTGAAPLVTSGQITPSAPQQTQQQQLRQSQKGSGQFVNLRGYIQQNQPKAQEISGAIGQNIGQQAQQIGQQVQKQQQDLAARIAENQGRIAEQQQFGQQQLQKALSAESTSKNPFSASDISRFRDITTGNENLGIVQGLNTTSAQQQLGELQRYTQDVQQMPIRNELLRSTFSKTGQYGAGQRGLDDMLLAASRPAMQSLTSSAQNTQQQYKNQLQQAQEKAAKDQLALSRQYNQMIGKTAKGSDDTLEGLKSIIDFESQRAQEDVQSMFDRIKKGQLTKEDKVALGLDSGFQYVYKQRTPEESQDFLNKMYRYFPSYFKANDIISAGEQKNIGGLDYNEYLNRIGTSAEDVISEKHLAQSRALAQLSGQTDPYLNAKVGRYQQSKQDILNELKAKQEQTKNEFQKALKHAFAHQEQATGITKPMISDWNDQFFKYLDFYNDPTSAVGMGVRLTGMGEVDPRWSGRIRSVNENLQAQYRELADKMASDFGMQKVTEVASQPRGLQDTLSLKQQEIESNVNTEAKKAQDEITALFDRIKSGQITQADADILGLKKGQVLMRDIGETDRSAALRAIERESSRGLVDLTPNVGWARGAVGGLNYQDFKNRINVTPEDIITEKQLAQSRALAQLAGQTDPYLNANVGGYEQSKQKILSELAEQQKQANLAREHVTKNIAGPQLAADVLKIQPGTIDSWDLRFNPYIQYYTDDQGRTSARLTKHGEEDPRFRGNVAAVNEQIARQMLQYSNKADTLLGLQQAQIAKDGGIMKSKYERFGRVRGKVK